MPPGLDAMQLKQMLPPAMQKPAWQQLQEMGIGGQGSAEANKAMLAQKMAGQQLGLPGGPPPSAPMAPGGPGAPNQSVSGPGGPGGAPPAGPGLPPGAEPGTPPPAAPGGAQTMPFFPGQGGPQGMQGGFGGMNPQQLRQMLPPAMQGQTFGGRPGGLNPQQIMPQPQAPGGGFNPGAGGAQGGGNPFRYM